MKTEAIDFDELEKAIIAVKNSIPYTESSHIRNIHSAAQRLLELRKNTCVFGDSCSAKLKYQEMVNAKNKQ